MIESDELAALVERFCNEPVLTKLTRRQRSALQTTASLLVKDQPGSVLVLGGPDGGPHIMSSTFANDSVTICGLPVENMSGCRVVHLSDACPECRAAIPVWSERRSALSPDEILIERAVYATEGDRVTMREAVEAREHLAVLIQQGADQDSLNQAMITVGLAMAGGEDAKAGVKAVMIKVRKRLRRRGDNAYPPPVQAAIDRVRKEERELKQRDDIVHAIIGPWVDQQDERERAAIQARMEEQRRQHEHDREHRIERHRAERQERERRADVAAQATVIVPKPAPPQPDTRLSGAVAAAMASQGRERAVALKALRAVAVECGDERWSTWAKGQLRELRNDHREHDQPEEDSCQNS